MAKQLVKRNAKVLNGKNTIHREAIEEFIVPLEEATTFRERNLILDAPWTTSSNWSTPKTYRIGELVYLQGYVTGGSTGRTNKITKLPSGYLPLKYMKFFVAPNTVVQIDLNGDVWVESGPTTNVFLNGIVYRVKD